MVIMKKLRVYAIRPATALDIIPDAASNAALLKVANHCHSTLFCVKKSHPLKSFG
jgi:hypothetical protein